MSRKSVISKRILGNVSVSDVAQGGGFSTISIDTYSDPLNVADTNEASFHLEWQSSTLIATVYVQARNGGAAKDDWRNLDFGSAISISGAAGEHEVVLLQMPFTDLRIFVDVASGSGQVGCSFTAKAVGN